MLHPPTAVSCTVQSAGEHTGVMYPSSTIVEIHCKNMSSTNPTKVKSIRGATVDVHPRIVSSEPEALACYRIFADLIAYAAPLPPRKSDIRST